MTDYVALHERMKSLLTEDGDITDAALAVWPNCAVADCEFKCSLRLQSPYCHVHTVKSEHP